MVWPSLQFMLSHVKLTIIVGGTVTQVPSSLVPLFRNESKCETFHKKMSSACSFIFMQINGFAIRLALKQRHKGTRKWPIVERGWLHG